MAPGRRRELFPPDRGLQIRMAVGVLVIWATHPSLKARLEQLERKEDALHGASSRI